MMMKNTNSLCVLQPLLNLHNKIYYLTKNGAFGAVFLFGRREKNCTKPEKAYLSI